MKEYLLVETRIAGVDVAGEEESSVNVQTAWVLRYWPVTEWITSSREIKPFTFQIIHRSCLDRLRNDIWLSEEDAMHDIYNHDCVQAV